MIGASLAHYRVTAALGAGGMGEVWRATDTRLGREVALKLLPEDFAVDAERHARFEREAKTLAALNHPNIATLYGLEHLDDRHALVMELVEGEALDARLARGPIPVDEAVPIAQQIAEALEAAHEKGIVHRDLKPANVMVRPDGTVKVLDFGLAKAWDEQVAEGSLSLSPTITSHHTRAGVILGTAAYMAPEQAKGQAVDRRADIWAFGVVVWEMLTGRQLFAGDSVSETLAEVLKSEIDASVLPPKTPPPLRTLLRRCLERNPKQRLRDVGDARIVLSELLEKGSDGSSGRSEDVAPGRRRTRLTGWGTMTAVVVFAAVTAFLVGRADRPPASRMTVDIGAPFDESFHFQGDFGAPAVLSPDGAVVAFGARGGDSRTRLWIRRLATGEERRLEGTEDASAPFFSPDGGSLGFFSKGALHVVDVAGGPPLRLADAPNGRGGAWFGDDTIVFAPDFRTGLFRVRATGGPSEPLTKVDAARHSSHRWPITVPGQDAVVYLAMNHQTERQGDAELRWVRRDGSEDHALLPSLANAAIADGYLFFLRDKALFAQSFDAGAGVLRGEPTLVARDVLFDPSTWRGTFAAVDGLLLYAPGSEKVGTHLSRVDRLGRPLEEIAPDAIYFDISLSHDGRRLLVSRGQPSDLWMLDLERGTSSRFTFEPGDEFAAVWSPDDSWIYYVATGTPSGRDQLFRKASGGASAAQAVFEADEEVNLYPSDVSPDGRWLALAVGVYPFISESDVAVLSLERFDELQEIVSGPAVDGDGRFSPDGRWLVYSSYESGSPQVYVRSLKTALDGEVARWQISVDGGFRPLWAADGREVVYLEPSLNLSRVAVTADGADGLRFGRPEAMFGTTLMADQQSFALAPDGRSLILNHFGEAQSRPLRLVLGATAHGSGGGGR